VTAVIEGGRVKEFISENIDPFVQFYIENPHISPKAVSSVVGNQIPPRHRMLERILKHEHSTSLNPLFFSKQSS
jgi:hypothetical protein